MMARDTVISQFPSETIHAIVLCFLDDCPENKQALSRCTLTCRYWDAPLRPLLFGHPTLSLREDIDTLLALTMSFSLPKPPLADCIHSLSMTIHLPATRKPWWHRAYKLNRLRQAVVIRLVFVRDGTSWYGSGPTHGIPPVFRGPCHGGSRAVSYRLLVKMANFHRKPSLDHHTPEDFDKYTPFLGLIVPQQVYTTPGRAVRLPTIRFFDDGRRGVSFSRALNKQLDFRAPPSNTGAKSFAIIIDHTIISVHATQSVPLGGTN
ncbi:uncharacterized protein PHACADRAFT_186868 [Phanerochaete carnosa HHB-10118-sp]|uniref:F-box domain-containing protein n=1 Tax=Phanerochaete carnosa (strain HHB-10118-sp) TaxID=650164 RepID=K5USF3_PHACS|nr:uncharacterized protein PHACADRAFT_186868 [Phanerochaete carnosa HHB-10118-sp]EKM52806.1 hypothetical protein PHACADRAFT_186868 [Phanerochaete carnosa HHB-10118-sp]